MTGSNSSKILTVSYGTFSCTLEGFDDPFSTMRHIAEYFRDLAADDRYFGAEPPTPDAEMLHRIAEREIQRRVESRVQGDGVVLRQLDTGLAEDEADAPAAEVIAEDEPATREAAAEEFETAEARPEPAPEPQTDEAPAVEVAEETGEETGESPDTARADSIEEKLSRIRAVVERSRSRDIGAGGLAAAVTDEADADEEAMVADMSPGFAADIDASLISQVISEQSTTYEVMPGEETAEEDAPVWQFDDRNDDDAVDAGEERATEPAETSETDEDGAGEDALVAEDGFVEGENVDDDEAAASEAQDHATDDAIAKIMAFNESHGVSTTGDTAPLAEDEPEVEAPAEITLELSEEDDSDEDFRSEEIEEMSDEFAATAHEVEEDADEIHAEADQPEDTDETDGVEDDAATEERAVASDEAVDVEERTLDVSGDMASEWKDDAEADALPRSDNSLAETRARRSLSKSSQLRAPEEESPHIETRTETAFRDDAGSRRRSAIAHLRAAVAATRADRILSRVVGRDPAADPEEQKSYREDLSKVVKPREISQSVEPRADAADETTAGEGLVDDAELTLDLEVETEAETPSSRRPTSRVKTRLLGPEDTVSSDDFIEEDHYEDEEEDDAPREATGSRSSPLMLVSALRVADESRAEARKSQAEETETEDSDDGAGFVAFATRMGASELGDLIEAAAAYSAFVEGKPHFSRPQVMRRVGRIDPTIEESREAALRAFGQLLRQGRITKLERGQFRVSDATRFNPEARIAGE